MYFPCWTCQTQDQLDTCNQVPPALSWTRSHVGQAPDPTFQQTLPPRCHYLQICQHQRELVCYWLSGLCTWISVSLISLELVWLGRHIAPGGKFTKLSRVGDIRVLTGTSRDFWREESIFELRPLLFELLGPWNEFLSTDAIGS